jgi:hypothetical protein
MLMGRPISGKLVSADRLRHGNMAKHKPTAVPLSAEARGQILTVIQSSAEPLTARSLVKLLAASHHIPEKLLGPILVELVAARALHAFPGKTAKGKPRYWNHDALELGRQVILKQLESQGQRTEAQLRRAAKGFSDAQFQEILHRAIANGEVWRHPPIGKAKKEMLGRRPPSPEPYLREIADKLTTIVTRLTEANVPQGDLRRALVQLIEAAGVPFASAAVATRENPARVPAPAVDLMALMRRIEPGADRGALVVSRDLRRAAKMEKQAFDRAVLELARQGRLSLHQHDFASALSPAERDELVTDGTGAYYVGMALRHNAGGT